MKKSTLEKIEAPPIVYQHGWDDPTSTTEGYIAYLSKANKIVDLVEYLEKDYVLEATQSNTDWTHKMNCPFHNWGLEKIPSFFINSIDNRFYCQACAVSGGLVDFISLKFHRPLIIVAEHIVNCVEGKVDINDIETKKVLNKKIFEKGLSKISDIYRGFVHQYKDCDDAIEYANKCMSGFDNVWDSSPKKVEEAINDLVVKFGKYFERYGS